MATGAFTLNNKMQTNLAGGLLDFSTGTWKAILLTSTAPVATAETLSDVSGYQPSNAGYAEQTVTCSVTGNGNNVVSFGNASFTASGGSYTARYISYYETGAGLLTGYMLLDENDTDITINNGETVTISAPNAIIIGTTYVLEVNGQNGNVEFEYDHRNLLLNPFFTVNSKGQSTYTIASGVNATVDSWKGQKTSGTDATITVNSNGVSLTNPDTTNTLFFYQDLSSLSSFLNGKSMTVSLKFQDDTSADYQFTFNGASVTVHSETDYNVRIYVGGSFTFQFCIDVKPTKTLNLKAVKLELGDISTLAYDTLPNENEQLNLIYGGNAKSNRNLIDNPFFTVNQRGSSTYSLNGYTVDRWITGNSNLQLDVNSNSITLTNNGASQYEFIQRIESTFALYAGKTLTLSIKDDSDNIYYNTATIPNTAPASTTFYIGIPLPNDSGDFNFAYTAGLQIFYADLRLKAGKTITIKAVKLELGSISTLAYDAPPSYAEELLKCQRYFLSIKNSCTYAGIFSSQYAVEFTIPTPIAMRTTPTLTGITLIASLTSTGAINSTSIVSQSVMHVNANSVECLVTYTADTAGVIYSNVNVFFQTYNINLSADL